MARAIVLIGALLGFGTAVLGFATVKSDIQLIIAAVGAFSALVLLGIGAVLSRLDKQWNYMIDIEEQVRARHED